MKDVFLRRVGRTLAPTSQESEEALESYAPGTVVRAKLTQERSLPHHKFFFAFLPEVYKNWPKAYKIQPADEDWMRDWLTVKAGVKEMMVVAWDVLGTQDPLTAVAILKRVVKMFTKRPVFFSIDPNEGLITMEWAKSIAFHKMDEQDFQDTTMKVFDVIYEVTGMDVEEYYTNYLKDNPKVSIEPKRSVRGSGK